MLRVGTWYPLGVIRWVNVEDLLGEGFHLVTS